MFIRSHCSRISVVLALALVVICSTAGLAADQAIKFTGPANSYVHIYRPFPATAGSEISAQLSVKSGPDAGSSWAPSVFVYWSPTNFAGIGQQPDGAMRINAQGLGTFKATQPGIRANDWTEVRIDLTATLVRFFARPAGGEWALVSEVTRPDGFAGMPTEVILGKGFGNNTPTYPAEHLDNSTAKPAKVGTSFIDNVVITVDGKEVLKDSFTSLDAWKQHTDATVSPVIELVSQQDANAAFAVAQ